MSAVCTRPPCLQSRRREQERLERLDEEWEAQKQKEEFEKKQVRRSFEWLETLVEQPGAVVRWA